MPSVDSLYQYTGLTYTSVSASPPVRELSRGATVEDGTPRHLDEETEKKARISVAKVLLETKQELVIEIETGSVYGSAFVIPQIARSAMWSRKTVTLCIRCYFFLALNCFLQWFLVYELQKESQVMNKFGGKMWLCDFGAQKIGCPDADGCIGPGGTRITPSRMYSFNQWNLMGYAKVALMDIFPDRKDEIDEKMDPGEYGLESSECRLLCTLLFVFAISKEFTGSMRMIRLLHNLPSRQSSWVEETEDGEIQIRMSGMPWIWKVINFLFVVTPRFMLWQFTTRTGMLFLIETAGMENTIVNATALCFILDIDELMFEVFSTDLTKHLLDNLEGFRIPKHKAASYKTVSGALSRDEEDVIEQSDMNRFFSKALVPWMVIQAMAIWAYFQYVYYSTHCYQSSDGTYVSNPMYLPKSTSYSHWSAFLPQLFPIDEFSTPYWTWAGEDPG